MKLKTIILFLTIAFFSNAQIEYEKTTGANHSIYKTLSNFPFGAGFNFDKYSIEARIFSSTQILKGATPQRYADYNNISLNFRYQLL